VCRRPTAPGNRFADASPTGIVPVAAARAHVVTLILVLTLAAYGAGALMGLAADRGGPRLQRDWPVYLRVQLIATACVLTLFSAWQLTAPHQLIAPILISGVAWFVLAVAALVRKGRSAGQAALEGWAAYPNSAFWVLPMAGALVGPSASMITALSNAAYAAPNALCIHFLRRDAPLPQRRATTWVDQSAVAAVAAGLALHLAGPAPAGSHWVLRVSGPLFAFVGAALFTGSVLHPQNVTTPRSAHDLRRWAGLSGARVLWLLPVAVVTRSTAVAVIAVLSALGAPAFNPAQMAVLYGYRSGVVNTAVRWGWVLLPVGLAVAILIR